MRNESLNQLLSEYIEYSDNPDVNFDVAVEYETLGQLASAITFYLRAAEFGFESAPSLVYASLIKVGLILEKLGNRSNSASNAYLQAISYQPSRPEAYFVISRMYQRNLQWQESYTFAITGQMFVMHREEPITTDLEYRGAYCLKFQQAVAAWWIGRKNESKELFEWLLKHNEMEREFVDACNNNLKLWASDAK